MISHVYKIMCIFVVDQLQYNWHRPHWPTVYLRYYHEVHKHYLSLFGLCLHIHSCGITICRHWSIVHDNHTTITSTYDLHWWWWWCSTATRAKMWLLDNNIIIIECVLFCVWINLFKQLISSLTFQEHDIKPPCVWVCISNRELLDYYYDYIYYYCFPNTSDFTLRSVHRHCLPQLFTPNHWRD